MVIHKKKQPLFEAMSALTGSPNTPFWVLPGWLLGGTLVNLVSEKFGWVSIVALAVLYAFVYCWFFYRRGLRKLSVDLDEKSPSRMRGLILPVSTLSLTGQSSQDMRNELQRICQNNVEEELSIQDQQCLERSNLRPALAALEYHYNGARETNEMPRHPLQEVWMITTEETTDTGEVMGSCLGVAKLLERWFFTRNPEARGHVVFHYDSYQGISLRVCPRDYSRLWEVVDAIYRKAPYKPEQIIAEITPGTKVMSIAIALACLPPGRTLEYMVASRDCRTGEPTQENSWRPMLIDIDPYLEEGTS